MSGIDFKSPVVDSVPKVNEEVAVGEDVAFQRKWWIFERLIWSFFGFILLLTVLGVFGRGPVAITQKRSPEGDITLKYDRIERTGTPTDLRVLLGRMPSAAVQFVCS